jgi:hypothetical protein
MPEGVAGRRVTRNQFHCRALWASSPNQEVRNQSCQT